MPDFALNWCVLIKIVLFLIIDMKEMQIAQGKIYLNKTKVLVAGTNKAGRLTGQAGQVQRCAPSTANIFAAATNRTNRQYMTLSINNVFVLSYQLK